MMVFSHLPYWVWHLMIGIVVGLGVCYWYRTMPRWFRVPLFVLTVPLWPFTFVGWLTYENFIKPAPKGN